jgi:flagellar basal-body rod protein FlgG
MFRALEIAASGMAGEQTAMNTIANNMANANTPAFKDSQVRFEEMLSVEGASGTWDGQGVRVAANQRDTTQGALQATGQTWDMAINGAGYFPLMDPNGQQVYTRSGSFNVNAEGQLVNLSGNVLAGGISVPTGTTNVAIAADGTITGYPPSSSQSGQPVTLGKINLVTFANEQGLTDQGGGVFAATDASGPALTQEASAVPLGLGGIVQGSLESSNVNMVTEMVNLISTQRAYETGAKVITAADEMLGYVNGLVR